MAELQATANEEVMAEDNIYEAEGVPQTENEKELLQVDLGAGAISKGGDLSSVLSDTIDQTPAEIKGGMVAEGVERTEKLIADTVDMVATEQPDALESVLGGASESLRALRAQSESEMAPYIAFYEGIEGSEKLTTEQVRELAANRMLLDVFAKKMDEQSAWGKIKNFLEIVAVPDYSYNSAAIFSDMTGDDMGFEEFLGSADALEALGKARESLSPVDRVAFDKMFIKSLDNVDTNAMQQFDSVLTLLGQNPEAATSQHVEKADIVLTLTPVIGQIANALKGAVRGANVMKQVGKAGDAVTAQTISKAVVNPEVATTVGVNPLDAASLGNPVANKAIFNGAPEGLQAAYRTTMEDVDESLRIAEDVIGYSLNLTESETLKMVDSVKKHMSKRTDIEDLKITPNAKGLTVEYKTFKNGKLSEETESVLYKTDDLGGFIRAEAAGGSTMLRGLASPHFAAREDRKLFVEAAQAGSFAAGKIGKQYGDAIDNALKPVRNKKESLAKIDYVLQELDGKEVNLSYQQLSKVGIGGVKLSDEEFIAVHGIRKTLDELWQTNNSVLRREKELAGVRSVKINGADDFGKVYDTPSAVNSANITIESKAMDVSGQVVELTSDAIEANYKKGKVLVKSDSAAEIGWYKGRGDDLVQYAWVNKADVKDLPAHVLNRVPNYLPKMQKDGNWFLKGKRKLLVNGKYKDVPVTIAYGGTHSQVQRFLDQKMLATRDFGDDIDPTSFQIVFDRQTPDKMLGDDTVSIAGGLIRGSRKQGGLQYAGDVADEKRVDAYEAIQRYMGITADKAALSEWRMEARQRWLNQAASHAGIRKAVMESDWRSAANVIRDSDLPTREKSKLLTLHGQVSTMTRIPTRSDVALQETIRSLALGAEKLGGESIAKYMYRIHDQSPTELAKTVVFHTTLGMGNLAQLPVQMFGAAVALSMEPRHAGKAMYKWLAASALDVGSNPKSQQGLAKKLGMDYEDYKFWQKSGMREGVIRGNADLGSIHNNLPYDAGVLRRGFHGMLNVGQTPYRMGELANMRISFFTALEREKALMGKKFVYDDATLSRVLAKAEQYRLNMGSGNKAAFQKGLWSLPTQFKQIYTKYIEALAGDFLTGKEKAKMVAGQLVLFGGAGVPLLNHASDYLADMLLPEDADELTVRAFKHGSTGVIINGILDADATFAGRITVSSDLIEELMRLGDERTSLVQLAMGASFTTGDRIYDLFTNIAKAGSISLADEDVTPEVQAASLDIILKSAARVTSSGRSWLGASAVAKGYIEKSNGTPLMTTDPTIPNIVARALGFSSLTAEEMYKISARELKSEQDRRDYASFLANMYMELHDNIEAQNETGVKAAHHAITMMREHVYSNYPHAAKGIMDKVNNILSGKNDFGDRTLKKATHNALDEFAKQGNMMMTEMMKERRGER